MSQIAVLTGAAAAVGRATALALARVNHHAETPRPPLLRGQHPAAVDGARWVEGTVLGLEIQTGVSVLDGLRPHSEIHSEPIPG